MDDKADLLIAASRLKRDASMMLLVALCQKSAQQLALLSNLEKRAVVSLIAAGQAIAFYCRSTQPDREVLSGFSNLMESISPSLAGKTNGFILNPESSSLNDELSELIALTQDVARLLDTLGAKG